MSSVLIERDEKRVWERKEECIFGGSWMLPAALGSRRRMKRLTVDVEGTIVVVIFYC